MKRFASFFPSLALTVALALAAGASLCGNASAQIREQMKTKIVDDVANQMVTEIQSDSCPEFESFMKSRKSGGSASSASGMMKKDPAMRQRFVNKVAGPLLNKMIDCNLLPSK